MSDVSKPPLRPLSCLSREECQALFAVAFGYAPPLEKLQLFMLAGKPLTIRFEARMLIIHYDGQVLAADREGNFNDTAIAFNAWKLINLLKEYNIHLGGYAPDANPL